MKDNNLKNMIDSFDNNKLFSQFISENYKDKYIEIYTGDDFDVINVEQSSHPNRAVFCGKVVGSVKEFLILDCFGTKPNREVVSGNLMFINTNMIVSLKPLNPQTPMTNVFLKSGGKTQVKLGD